MDLQWLAVAVIVISLPGAIWDLISTRASTQREGVQSWLQLAWLGLLVGALGLAVIRKWVDFSEALLVATGITGAILLVERFVLRTDEKPMFVDSIMDADRRDQPIPEMEPAWLDLGRSFFPVIFVVFFVRSFVAEPFKIPSGSMIPTLSIGDFILVNKYAYGLRLPVSNQRVIDVGLPQRGDVMVFRYPLDPTTDYIKRVVGLPGDVVTYAQKQLTINGVPVALSAAPLPSADELRQHPIERHLEQLGDHLHTIQTFTDHPPINPGAVGDFPNREACRYNSEGFTCTVPPGNYFMMGDNRDNSSDSRYWGFVPDRNIVGKAFVIWWNFEELSRIGRSIP